MRSVFGVMCCWLCAVTAACNATPDYSVPQKRDATAADKEQIWRYLEPWHNCMVTNTVGLDDGKSDPYTIARTASELCKAEFLTASDNVNAMGLYRAYTGSFLSTARDQEVTTATAAVLRHRKGDF